MKAYREDLAYIHDVGFGDFARRAAPGVLRLLPRPTGDNKLVVDLGCGSGIWAEKLLAAGYDALGFDISPAMVRIARRQAPKARFRVGSFLDAPIPPCIAVTAMGEVFNYTFDSSNSAKVMAAMLRRIHEALRPGGVLIFDIAEPGRVRGRPHVHATGEDWACLVDQEESPVDACGVAVLTRHITTFRKIGSMYRRSRETHIQRLYPAADVAAELRQVGFRVRIARSYGQFRLPPCLASLVARKPGP